MNNWIQTPDGAINLLTVTRIEIADSAVIFHFTGGHPRLYTQTMYPTFCDAVRGYVRNFPNLERYTP